MSIMKIREVRSLGGGWILARTSKAKTALPINCGHEIWQGIYFHMLILKTI